MKKILYVTTVSLTLNTFLIPHIRYLKEKGYDVQIASNIDVPLLSDFNELGIKHTKVEFSRNPFSIKNIKAYRQIKELYNKEKFDIVHVHTPVASFVTRLSLKSKETKMIYTCHGFHFYEGAPLINWLTYYPLEIIAARWTDTIVVINKEDLDRANKFKLRRDGKIFLMHGVGIEDSRYVIDNFDRDYYRKEIGLEKDDFAILILAELNKNKNHKQAIRAINNLKYDYPNIKLICAGSGPIEEELKNFVKELDLNRNVKFLGFRKDVSELLNSCDCVGLFSYREGLGKCLIEGMIAEKPVIATDTRGPRELINDNENGFLVKLKDEKTLAKKIERLYKEKDLQNKFIKKSRIKVEKYYMKNVLKELQNFY